MDPEDFPFVVYPVTPKASGRGPQALRLEEKKADMNKLKKEFDGRFNQLDELFGRVDMGGLVLDEVHIGFEITAEGKVNFAPLGVGSSTAMSGTFTIEMVLKRKEKPK